MNTYSKKSLEELNTCDVRLQNIFKAILPFRDHVIIQGHRTKEQHLDMIKKGATRVTYDKTMHRFNPSKAIDVSPYPIPLNWGSKSTLELVKFYNFASIVLFEAYKQGVNIRWGGDWDSDGDYSDQKFNDLVHFELR